MNNAIHPTAIIGENVKMGTGNTVGPFCIIADGVEIGSGNVFRASCVVGTPAQKVGYLCGENSKGVVIGDNNHFSEGVIIHAGTEEITTIGNRVIMLHGAHLAHDATCEDDVTISARATVAGHCHLMRGCNIGIGASVHQHQVVGSFVMLGGNCFAHKNIKLIPGLIFVGVPARLLRNNNLALQKRGITSEMLQEEIIRYRQILVARGMA